MYKLEICSHNCFEKDSILEFLQVFNNDQTCQMYLSQLKWKDGFLCKRCHHNKCFVTKDLNCECTSCHYTETPTSGTVFHNVKFGLQKAFAIFYEASRHHPKPLSARHISVRYDLTTKTSLKFLKKVHEILDCTNSLSLEEKIIFKDFKMAL